MSHGAVAVPVSGYVLFEVTVQLIYANSKVHHLYLYLNSTVLHDLYVLYKNEKLRANL